MVKLLCQWYPGSTWSLLNTALVESWLYSFTNAAMQYVSINALTMQSHSPFADWRLSIGLP